MGKLQCVACGGQDWVALPSWPNSMLSDGRLSSEWLAKETCMGCGLVRHATPLQSTKIKRIFDNAYRLVVLPIDNKFLRQRQRLYADWIFSLLPKQKNLSVFEIGAGNGSLLAQLSSEAPEWSVRGIEPVDAAAEVGRAAGYDVQTAFLDEFDTTRMDADAVVSINVIEHVVDPVSFLNRISLGIRDGGRILIVCPDGGRPSTELLIYDHVHSFTYAAMKFIAAQAGLRIIARTTAPAALGPFQAFVLAVGNTAEGSIPFDAKGLTNWRMDFLKAWKHLDDILETRLRGMPDAFAFGCGENAQLLRTYSPRAWSHIKGIYADTVGVFDGKPVRLYTPPTEANSQKMLLAVRPDLQNMVGDRLRRDGNIVVSWDDLIPSSG